MKFETHQYVKVTSVTKLPGTNKASIVFTNGEIVTVLSENLIVTDEPIRERVDAIDMMMKMAHILDLVTQIADLCETSPDVIGYSDRQDQHPEGPADAPPQEPAPRDRLAPEALSADKRATPQPPEPVPPGPAQEPERTADEQVIDRLLPEIAAGNKLPFSVNEPGTTGGALTREEASALAALWQREPGQRARVLNVVCRQMMPTLLKLSDVFPEELKLQIIAKKTMDGLSTNVIPPEWEIFMDGQRKTPGEFDGVAGRYQQTDEQKAAIDEINFELPRVDVDAASVIDRAKRILGERRS